MSQIKSVVERWKYQWFQRLSLGKNWEGLVSRGLLNHNLPRAVSVAAFRIRARLSCHPPSRHQCPTITRVPALQLWYYERQTLCCRRQ
ncbi:hypothetical protein TNCT_360201 [Trichonephila clavata]|uniref:Uncharacterized protein n=1 Tax=Trichonephila clavata TaxID=2740835 RepID=A0A8X6I065_TRICU|nr:hypothetical protein TNCT_360201 [Trichonephila clavata]